MNVNWTYATKAIVSVLGSAEYALSQYPHITWQQGANILISSFLVWLVPNTPSPQKVNVPANAPITNAERDELNKLRAANQQ